MLRVQLFSVADHAKQADALSHAINREVGVEYLVTAMLAVRLGKHHQLNIGRVAQQLREGIDQVIDFINSQRQAKLGIGFFKRCFASRKNVDGG